MRLALCLISVLLVPTFSFAESPRSLVPPLPPTNGPVMAIPWGPGITSYWDSQGRETQVIQSSPSTGYYTGPSGSGWIYDNFRRPEPLEMPSSSSRPSQSESYLGDCLY